MPQDKKKTLRDYFSDGTIETFGDKSSVSDELKADIVGGRIYSDIGGEKQYLGELLGGGSAEAYQMTLKNLLEGKNKGREYYDTKGVFGYVSPEQDTTYYHGGTGKSTDFGFSRNKLNFSNRTDMVKALLGQDVSHLDEYFPVDLEEGQTISDFIDQFAGFRDERTPGKKKRRGRRR